MLILKQLKLNQFLSHEDSTINFEKNCKKIILGQSGSGKSSIIDAIVFCLYNQGRVDSRNLIQRGKKFAKVELTLDDDGKLYKIIRTITDKGKHELVVLEGQSLKSLVPIKANGTKGVQEYLEKKILHSSYLLFINSILYPQNNVESFVNQTATRKKEIILEMINAEDYDEYYEKTREKITDLQNDIYISTTLVEKLKLQIAEDSVKAEKLTEHQNKQKGLEIKLAELKIEQDKLTKQLQELETIAVKVESKNKEIYDINQQKKVCNDTIVLAELKLERAKNADAEIALLKEQIKNIDEIKKELEDLNGKKNSTLVWQDKMLQLIGLKPIDRDFEKEFAEINRQLIQLMSKTFELCPEVQKACPILTRVRDREVKLLEEELGKRTLEKQEYVKQIEGYQTQFIALGEKPVVDTNRIEQLNALIVNSINIEKKVIEIEQNRNNLLDDTANVISVNRENIKKLDIALLTVNLELKALNDLLEGKTALRASLVAINDQYTTLQTEEKANSTLILIAGIAKENMERAVVEFSKLAEKNKEAEEGIENLKLLKEAFGQNGIKAMLIDYIIPKLEDSINNILGKLSDFRVKLDTQKSGVGEDIIKEGLFIEIYNELGEKFDFDSFSGGERVKVSSAVFEALASIQHFNFRILDESITSLDSESTEKFVEVMEFLQQSVAQIICVSHLAQIQETFMEKITVSKINGVSTIK